MSSRASRPQTVKTTGCATGSTTTSWTRWPLPPGCRGRRRYVIPDDDPNAFATGRDPAHASIAVTDGLLRDAES